MTTKTYYAKLNCLSNPTNKEHIANEQYKNICDFMSFLTGSGVADLVSWNSGSGAVSGSFNTRTYWDGTRPFGLGSHSLWKMKANADRPWDWYLYIQLVSDTATVAAQTFNQPILSTGIANFMNDIGQRGILFQTAVCFSGSTSFNPWNGTISDGNSTAANPRWVSGALDRTMYVLPRSNDLGGSHTTSRNNGVGIIYQRMTTNNQNQCNYIYDGDSLFMNNDRDFSRTINFGYLGTFDLNASLSGSGICNGTKGFIMYFGTDNINTINTNVVFGDTAGTSVGLSSDTCQGGVGVPLGVMTTGSRGGILQVMNNFPGTSYQPNQLLEKFDEFPIYVGISESPHFGYLGSLDTGFMKAVVGAQSYHVSQDFSRACLGSNLTANNRKITVPWTGSYAPGYIGAPREGYTFTWTKDYG